MTDALKAALGKKDQDEPEVLESKPLNNRLRYHKFDILCIHSDHK